MITLPPFFHFINPRHSDNKTHIFQLVQNFLFFPLNPPEPIHLKSNPLLYKAFGCNRNI
jgi:hypothetical protein